MQKNVRQDKESKEAQDSIFVWRAIAHAYAVYVYGSCSPRFHFVVVKGIVCWLIAWVVAVTVPGHWLDSHHFLVTTALERHSSTYLEDTSILR